MRLESARAIPRPGDIRYVACWVSKLGDDASHPSENTYETAPFATFDEAAKNACEHCCYVHNPALDGEGTVEIQEWRRDRDLGMWRWTRLEEYAVAGGKKIDRIYPD